MIVSIARSGRPTVRAVEHSGGNDTRTRSTQTSFLVHGQNAGDPRQRRPV